MTQKRQIRRVSRMKGAIRSDSSVFKKKSITTVHCTIAGCEGKKGRKEKRINSAPTLNFSQNLNTQRPALPYYAEQEDGERSPWKVCKSIVGKSSLKGKQEHQPPQRALSLKQRTHR